MPMAKLPTVVARQLGFQLLDSLAVSRPAGRALRTIKLEKLPALHHFGSLLLSFSHIRLCRRQSNIELTICLVFLVVAITLGIRVFIVGISRLFLDGGVINIFLISLVLPGLGLWEPCFLKFPLTRPPPPLRGSPLE